MRVVLFTPPYPTTAHLSGFLRRYAADLDLVVTHADPALTLLF